MKPGGDGGNVPMVSIVLSASEDRMEAFSGDSLQHQS